MRKCHINRIRKHERSIAPTEPDRTNTKPNHNQTKSHRENTDPAVAMQGTEQQKTTTGAKPENLRAHSAFVAHHIQPALHSFQNVSSRRLFVAVELLEDQMQE